MKDILYVTLVALLAVVIIAIVPVVNIWALNSLFSLGIAYSLKNIVAMLWLSIVFGSLSGYVHNR